MLTITPPAPNRYGSLAWLLHTGPTTRILADVTWLGLDTDAATVTQWGPNGEWSDSLPIGLAAVAADF